MPVSNHEKHLPKRVQKSPSDFIDNDRFLEAILDHKNKLKLWREGKWPPEGSNLKVDPKEAPRISEYLGKCFWDLAENYSYNRSFIQYPFRADMVMDAVYFCVKYIDTFKPEITKNPFSYFTTTCHNAFLQKIEKEKKYLYTKYKAIENYEILEDECMGDGRKKTTTSTDGKSTDFSMDKRNEFVEKYEERLEKKRLEKEQKDLEKKALEEEKTVP